MYTQHVQFWTDTGRILYYTNSGLIAGEEHCLSHPSYLRLNCCLSRVGLLPVLRAAAKRYASPAVCARQ